MKPTLILAIKSSFDYWKHRFKFFGLISVYCKIYHSLFFSSIAAEEFCPWGLRLCLILSQCRHRQPTGHRFWPTRRWDLWLTLLLWCILDVGFCPGNPPSQSLPRLPGPQERGFACFSALQMQLASKTPPRIPALLVLTVCLALSRVHYIDASMS